MKERTIDTWVPDDAYQRLKVYKARNGLTWTGVLVRASKELPDEAEAEP